MVVISNYLLNHPYELTSLNTFAEKYESAKSSISEDIVIIKRAFEEIEIGTIETITGAGGGVVFTPSISDKEAKTIVEKLRDQLSESDRILPGGYIYLSDLLSTPSILNSIGRIIAKAFRGQKIDAVMTVATKGVPLANAVANTLNVPFVIVRRDLKITEGSTVSVNYVSGSSDRIEKMFLSKRSLKAGSRVLIVDEKVMLSKTLVILVCSHLNLASFSKERESSFGIFTIVFDAFFCGIFNCCKHPTTSTPQKDLKILTLGLLFFMSSAETLCFSAISSSFSSAFTSYIMYSIVLIFS